MKYKVEITRYKRDTTIIELAVTEMDENILEGVLDDVEATNGTTLDMAMLLVQKLPHVLSADFTPSENTFGVESVYEKIDDAETSSLNN